jgi:hypothetical protein
MKISRHVVSGFLLFGLIGLCVACESVSEPMILVPPAPAVRPKLPVVNEVPAPVITLEPEPPVISEAPAPEPEPEPPVISEAPEPESPVVVEIALIEEVAVPENVVFDSGNSIEDAIQRSYEVLLEILPNTASIAIVKIDSDNKDEAKFAVEKLSFLLLHSTLFNLVERRNLDSVLNEQRFQRLGEIDDRSAQLVGQRTGAEISITGTIREEESVRYLRLRTLDVQTRKILAETSEQFVAKQSLLTQANSADRATTTVSD